MKTMRRVALVLLMTVMVSPLWAQFFTPEDLVGTKAVYKVTTIPADGQKLVATTIIELIAKEGDVLTLSQSIEFKSEDMEPLNTSYSYSTMYDDKGIHVDPDMLKHQILSQFKNLGIDDADMQYEGTENFTPLYGEVGDEFPLFEGKATVSILGMKTTVHTKAISSKVIAKEIVEVPAGTFETFVHEVVSETTTKALWNSEKQTSTITTWIVLGKGYVKYVTSSDGKISSIMELVEVIKP